MPPVFICVFVKAILRIVIFRENLARPVSIPLVFTIRICYIEERTKLPERILAFSIGQLVQFKQEV